MRKSHEILAELNLAMEQFASAEGEARAALAVKIDALTRELNEAQIDEAARRAIANQRVLSKEEKRALQSFSISKFLREAANGDDKITGLEGEIAAEGKKEFERFMGKSGEGVFLPSTLTRSYDYNNASEANYGQALVAEGQSSYVEALRNAMVAKQLGVRFIDGLVGNLALVKEGGATAAWLAEEGSASVQKPTYSKVVMKPHRLQIIQGVTYDLIHQSVLAVDNLIMDDLRRAHAEALDAAIFAGTGSSGQPTGILNTSGIGSVAMGSNGDFLDYGSIVDLETTVGAANGLFGSLAYVTNSKVNGYAKQTPQIAGYPLYLFNDGKTNGYPVAVTNSIPSTLTKGETSSKCSAMIFGNFNEVLCAGWGGLQFIIDPFTAKEKGVLEISAHAYHDVLVRRPACFAAIADIITEAS